MNPGSSPRRWSLVGPAAADLVAIGRASSEEGQLPQTRFFAAKGYWLRSSAGWPHWSHETWPWSCCFSPSFCLCGPWGSHRGPMAFVQLSSWLLQGCFVLRYWFSLSCLLRNWCCWCFAGPRSHVKLSVFYQCWPFWFCFFGGCFYFVYRMAAWCQSEAFLFDSLLDASWSLCLMHSLLLCLNWGCPLGLLHLCSEGWSWECSSTYVLDYWI